MRSINWPMISALVTGILFWGALLYWLFSR